MIFGWIGVAMAGEAQQLAGGLRAQVVPIAAAPSVEVAFAFAAGEVDDPPGYEGLAHLTEHLWFQNRVGGVPVRALYERLGCASNAWTSDTWTDFILSCPPESFAELLGIETARFAPWSVGAETVAREWRVVSEEELDRADRDDFVEMAFLIRQLLPASHPARLRAARPRLGSAPSAQVLRSYVDAQLRPGNGAVSVVGGIEESEMLALLAGSFGAPTPAPALPPLRPTAPVAETLRLAPRTVPGVSRRPVVYVGWSKEPPPGLTGQAMELFVEVNLDDRYGNDPRVLSVSCDRAGVDHTQAFYCALTTRDAAAAASIGAELPGVLAGLSATDLKSAVNRVVEGQSRLWQLSLGQRRGAAFGALAAVVARGLLDGAWTNSPDLDLTHFIRGARLGDTGLVLILTGGGTPSSRVLRPPEVHEDPGGVPEVPLPLERPPLPVAVRMLENGLELIGVQRADATLLHVALVAESPDSPASLRAAEGAALGGVADGWRTDVLELDRRDGPTLLRSLASYPGAEAYLAELVHRRLTAATYDGSTFERRQDAADHGWALSIRTASWWAGTLPRIAGGRQVRPSGATLRRLSPTEVLAAPPYTPGRTRVVVVGPAPPEVSIAPFAAVLATWVATSPVVAEPAPPAPPPPRAFVPVPSVQAWIGADCPIGTTGGVAAVTAAVVSRRLVDALREERGISYSPAAYADDGELGVTISTDPANAAPAITLVEAALRAPAPAELSAARAAVLGQGSPHHLPPEDLATALAFGTFPASALTDWDGAARGSTEAAVGAALARCRGGLTWAISGPASTTIPAGTPTLDPAELAAKLRP